MPWPPAKFQLCRIGREGGTHQIKLFLLTSRVCTVIVRINIQRLAKPVPLDMLPFLRRATMPVFYMSFDSLNPSGSESPDQCHPPQNTEVRPETPVGQNEASSGFVTEADFAQFKTTPPTPPEGLGHSGASCTDTAAPRDQAPQTPPGAAGHSGAQSDSNPKAEAQSYENYNPDGSYFYDTEEDKEFTAQFNLTDKQFRAIEVAVQGYSDQFIAKFLNVNRKTIWRWKTQDAEYRRAFAAARAALHNTVTDLYHDTLLKATKTLRAFLDDRDNDNNRFRAAQTLMNMAGSFRFPAPKEEPEPEDDELPMPVVIRKHWSEVINEQVNP
jgi:hypothetical protein